MTPHTPTTAAAEIVRKKCLHCGGDITHTKKFCCASHGQKFRRKINLELQKSQKRNYYIANKDYINKKSRIYQKSHPEKRRVHQRTYKAKHRAVINLKRNLRFKNLPNDHREKLRQRLQSRVRQVLKSSGIRKCSKTMDLLGCSILDFKKHIESQFKRGMSWGKFGFRGIHLDHIKPCASFDLSNPE